jgi:hypothetical protein
MLALRRVFLREGPTNFGNRTAGCMQTIVPCPKKTALIIAASTRPILPPASRPESADSSERG